MKKRLIRILSIILMLLYITCTVNNVATAVTGNEITTAFDAKDTAITDDDATKVRDILGIILSAVRIVAAGVSVIMITILGIKYMMAAPNEKANIKSQLITFTIGAVVIIAAASLIGMVKDFAQNAVGQTT